MKTKCAIMQPHFFPWSGYFNLISKVNKFIFLDDAQYSKNSWQSRNKILINNEIKWITAHTKKSSTKNTKILEKKLDDQTNWVAKLNKTIIQNYSKHKHFNNVLELLENLDQKSTKNLAELNIKLIKFICNKIDINSEFILSSSFNIKKTRTDKIIELIKKINATEYLTVIGSENYLAEDNFEKKTKIKLKINNYLQLQYRQYKQINFIKNLSIIDVIANLGWQKTSNYVKEKI
tara:strand:+ start:1719 stop:2420 length:702 start_codon:yes stop_codon:yes gene_type:complete